MDLRNYPKPQEACCYSIFMPCKIFGFRHLTLMVPFSGMAFSNNT